MVSFQNHHREPTWKVTVVFIHASSETPKRVLPVEGRTWAWGRVRLVLFRGTFRERARARGRVRLVLFRGTFRERARRSSRGNWVVPRNIIMKPRPTMRAKKPPAVVESPSSLEK